jgi:eukaryotic-like serine/threonine-protein kinase
LFSANSPDELCPACLVQVETKDEACPAVRGTMVIKAGSVLPQVNTQLSPTVLPANYLLGGYRIIRPLGKGGMGAVYEAQEIESGRRVALKILNQSLDSRETRRRFLREGRLAASVNHPNTVYVFGTDEIGGQPVIVMELVSGGTLQELVELGQPMDAAKAVDAILQVISGLEAAAALGVLHRDIKPSNCFVETDGTVKVGDFGLSISISTHQETKLTMAGSFLGTPAFSAPEQLRGDHFTIQSDIYAVGVTLYFLLTGRTPFQSDDLVRMLATVLERPAESPAQSRSDLPKGLCRAVLRCLEKQPAKRFKNYGELRHALWPYSSAAPTPATLSLRFLAGCVDGIALSIATSVFSLLEEKLWGAMSGPAFSQNTVRFNSIFNMVVVVFYYAVPEGLWGASFGKWICRLRVTGPNRGLPGFPRALVRAVIFESLPALPVWLFAMFAFIPHPSATGAFALMGLSISAYVIMALLFSTARRRNGFAAVQDLLTRTRVVRKSAHEARPGMQTVQDEAAALATAPQVGIYHVLETLEKTDGAESLLGFDTRLLRRVWLRKLPAGAPPVASSLRKLARVGRLRWLNGKRSDEECWDAYEAVPGKALCELIRSRQPWSRVRFWLLDLAEEIHASEADQSLPAILELDRVWITADGRAKLLDFPAPGSFAPRNQTPPAPLDPVSAASVSSPQRFLNQVAVSALKGRPMPAADAQAVPVLVPLPLHARNLLDELQAGLSPENLADKLKPLLGKLAFVSRARRLALIASSSVLPLTSVALFAVLGIAITKLANHDSDADALNPYLTRLNFIKHATNLPGGLDGGGAAYSANLLGPALGGRQTPFHLGPTNAPDVISAWGQTIALPSGRFSNFTMLATAVQGPQENQLLNVNYVDNTNSKWTQSFSDWCSASQNYPRESNILSMTYRDQANGAKDHRVVHLYAYSFPLDPNRVARSLVLPENPDLEVLAITLEPPAITVDLSFYFNRANGITADGSSFAEEKHLREAFEIYIAGRFRPTITNPATWTSFASAMIPANQRETAEKLVATRAVPSESELQQAKYVVEPYMEKIQNRKTRQMFTDPVFLVSIAFTSLIVLSGLPSLLMALCFRGGLVLRMLGLAVVKKDGTPASRLRIFWRGVIAWSPAILAAVLMTMLIPVLGEVSWGRGLLLGLILILAVCLAAWAALLPDRGLHDRLAGTCLVPRE